MRVVFVQDVTNVAEAGEVKEVKRGYAKNFLLPRALAVPATANELNRIEALKKAAAINRVRRDGERDVLASRLEGVELVLLQRAGPMGQLYGSVTNAVIADELSRILDQSIDRRTIQIAGPIRQTGEYEVSVHLGPDRDFPLKLVVTTEEMLQAGTSPKTRTISADSPAMSMNPAGVDDQLPAPGDQVLTDNPESEETDQES
jgi:large subunit ribosomal protein L9